MADAADLKSAGVTPMWVRVPPALLTMKLVEKVGLALRQAAETIGLDLQNSTLVIGVSGGPDSLALFHLLTQLIPLDRLIVAHLDHSLRPTSAAEAEIVASAAGNLRFHQERIDVAAMARAEHLTIEEAGRAARYDFLARVAQSEGASVVAVGHNADDQVETVLMHFLRGSGLAGLRGMQTASPLPGRRGLWLLRPLLQITRVEIEVYCAENGLAPIIDASNMDTTFLRNRLRHELLPALETYNPQIRQRLREMADILAADETLLTELSERAWRDVRAESDGKQVVLRRSAWQELPLALRRRILRMALVELRPELRDVGFRTLESARLVAEEGRTGTRAILPGGVILLVSYDNLLITFDPSTLTAAFPQVTTAKPLPLPVPGAIELANGWRLTAVTGRFTFEAIETNADPWTAYVTVDAESDLVVRSRLRGAAAEIGRAHV